VRSDLLAGPDDLHAMTRIRVLAITGDMPWITR
jgi:hypothetical protein